MKNNALKNEPPPPTAPATVVPTTPAPTSSPAVAGAAGASSATPKVGSVDDVKGAVRRGSCNWCKKHTMLLDFSSILDGREIYCTGCP